MTTVIADVKAVIAAAVTAAGIKCFNNVPSVINPPMAVLKLTSGDWDTNLPRSTPRMRFELTVAMPAPLEMEEPQQNIDALLETDKIRDAIENADYTGKANYARVVGWRNYGEPVIDQYLGVVFDIVVV